jgi:hypothetical protein
LHEQPHRGRWLNVRALIASASRAPPAAPCTPSGIRFMLPPKILETEVRGVFDSNTYSIHQKAAAERGRIPRFSYLNRQGRFWVFGRFCLQSGFYRDFAFIIEDERDAIIHTF